MYQRILISAHIDLMRKSESYSFTSLAVSSMRLGYEYYCTPPSGADQMGAPDPHSTCFRTCQTLLKFKLRMELLCLGHSLLHVSFEGVFELLVGGPFKTPNFRSPMVYSCRIVPPTPLSLTALFVS